MSLIWSSYNLSLSLSLSLSLIDLYKNFDFKLLTKFDDLTGVC